MRVSISRILLLGLHMVLLLPINAQNVSYTTSGGFNMGLGFGRSSQSSDIKNSSGMGFDIRLGTPIYQKENALFALDWRFRFLAGYNRAYDHRENSDGTYSNIQLSHFNYDLELALTLNRLRERTRIILTGFAGAGIMHGITSSDLRDASDRIYDYSSIDPNRDASEILADLDQLTDNDFESPELNKAAILPTAGIYLGYAFTPRFALGIEHKMNFSLNENTGAFGIDMDNRVLPESSLDYNNYTSVIVKWTFGGGSSGKGRISAPDPVPAEVAYPPQVDIITPYTNPFETTESSVKVTARINNITRKEDISVKLNGQTQEFMFYSSISRIEINTNLRMGSNSLVILCQNEAGSDSDDLILLYGTPLVKNPPEISFINPPSGIEVAQNQYFVRIQSSHVSTKDDITLSVNGSRVYDFDYDSNGIISLNLDLNEGRNEIKVSGRNADGTAEDRTNITFVKSEQGFPPEVNFLRPYAPQSNTYESAVEIQAEISNVESQSDLSFRINGRNANDFSFNPVTKRLIATVPLLTNTTSIYISAQNKFGSDNDSRIIIKEVQAFETQPIQIQPAEDLSVETNIVETLPCLKPEIAFFLTESGTYLLSGIVHNVQEKESILLSVNGRPYNNWTFTPSNGSIQASFNFDPGTHRIDINASNACGSDKESKTITLAEPCIPPSVSFNITEVNSASATHQLYGRIQNVKNKNQVTLTINGSQYSGFQFIPGTGDIRVSSSLDPGSHTIVVSANNECGSHSESKTFTVAEPCIPPSVDFTISEVNIASATHQLSGKIQNVKNKSQVTLIIDGRPDNEFRFVPGNGNISHTFRFSPGSHTIIVDVGNECGNDSESKTISIAEPCIPPSVDFTISEINSESATHLLSGKIQNVKNKSQVTLIIDGRPDNGFQYIPGTGEIKGSLKLDPGSHTILVDVSNECGNDTETKQVQVLELPDDDPDDDPDDEEETDPNAGWTRINPGNSSWEFCLQTPNGNYTRDNLSNPEFSYSGAASALYFKPIAGGGTVNVNGKSFKLNPGQYYLFRGELKIELTNKRKGAMGHWSVYVESSIAPTTGKGNNRPKSPCETGNKNKNR